jgi:hypothetical protein
LVNNLKKILVERTQAKLQWLQNPCQINGDFMKNVRCEASTIFRTTKREYLKDRINALETEQKY